MKDALSLISQCQGKWMDLPSSQRGFFIHTDQIITSLIKIWAIISILKWARDSGVSA